MNASALVFRFRVFIFVLLYFVGFFPPWDFRSGSRGTLWLAASTLLARTGWIGLAAATLAVTLAALACLVAGTILRVWGTALHRSRCHERFCHAGRRVRRFRAVSLCSQSALPRGVAAGVGCLHPDAAQRRRVFPARLQRFRSLFSFPRKSVSSLQNKGILTSSISAVFPVCCPVGRPAMPPLPPARSGCVLFLRRPIQSRSRFASRSSPGAITRESSSDACSSAMGFRWWFEP